MSPGRSPARVTRPSRHPPVQTGATRLVDRALRWFLTAGSPINLAVVRITLCVLVFTFTVDDVLDPRSLPSTSTTAPDILGFLLVELPRGQLTMQFVAAGLALCAVLGAVGFKSRWAMSGVLFFGLYHYGVPQIFGKVDHNHHILWISLVLAIAPCGDALSIDSWGRVPARSPRYGFPLRVIWILLGLIYFFPGLWKLLSVGPEWASARNMSGIMWSEWIARGGYDPIIDISGDRLPLLIGGVMTLATELGFVFLMLWKRTRWMAVVAGIAFHLGVGLTIGIWFVDLPFLYVALIDWAPLVQRVAGSRDDVDTNVPNASTRVPLLTTSVCSVLVAGVVLSGAGRVIDGWPVASYPDFGYRVEVVHRLDLRADDEPIDTVAFPGVSRIERHRLLIAATNVAKEATRESARLRLADDLQRNRLCDRIDGTAVEIVRQQFRTVVGDPVPDGEPERVPILQCPT